MARPDAKTAAARAERKAHWAQVREQNAAEAAERKADVVAIADKALVPAAEEITLAEVRDETAGRLRHGNADRASRRRDWRGDGVRRCGPKDYTDRRRRQAQGIAKAKGLGIYRGRPEDTERNAGIADMLAKGVSWTTIQKTTGCSRATIAKVAARRLKPERGREGPAL